MQEGCSFMPCTAGARSSFNQLSCRITGSLDTALFHAAWQQLIDRHPVMRTSFHWEEFDKPMQVVHAHATLPWVQDDWRDLPEHEQRTRWQAHLESDRGVSRSIARRSCAVAWRASPPTRTCSAGATTTSCRWLVPVARHRRDLPGVWRARARRAAGAPPVRPYRDYIQWLQQHEPQAAQQYWTRYLEGFRSPTRCPRPHAQADERFGPRSAGRPVGRPERAPAAIRHHVTSIRSRKRRALVLSRYSGETDVVFGAVVSGRGAPLPGIEAMLGLFINTVPVRVRVDPRQPLVPWLKMIQARVAARAPFEHTRCPTSSAAAKCRRRRRCSRATSRS